MTILVAVFGLFHAQVLTVRPATQSPVHLVSPEQRELRGRLDLRDAAKLEGDFVLSVPGRIERRFSGKLDVRRVGQELIPILELELEDAVAAVVAAEMPASYPPEALKAQAIVARSWYSASRGRHRDYDFCDTTHCQVFKEAAVRMTPPLVIRYNGQALAALYSASCGGTTMTAEEVGMNGEAYPYFRIECEEKAEGWERRFRGKDAEALQVRPHAESVRISLCRALGWDALPGNRYLVERSGDGILLRGKGRGHGLGLCQQGAAAMARRGAPAARIIEHYYPNTTLAAMR